MSCLLLEAGRRQVIALCPPEKVDHFLFVVRYRNSCLFSCGGKKMRGNLDFFGFLCVGGRDEGVVETFSRVSAA